MLKEIGSEDEYRDQVAEIIVGLETIDPDLINKYVAFVDGLDQDNREKLFKAIIINQFNNYQKMEELAKENGLDVTHVTNSYGSITHPVVADDERKLERMATIHEAMLATNYMRFLDRSWT